MSRILPALSRAALPLVAALFTVGLASAPAVAGAGATPAAEQSVVPAAAAVSLPPPPHWIRREDCARGGGHWVRDRRDPHLWHCVGGRWDRHDGRW